MFIRSALVRIHPMAKVGQKNWQLRQILLQPQPSATRKSHWLPLESCVDGRHLRLLVCSRLALPRSWVECCDNIWWDWDWCRRSLIYCLHRFSTRGKRWYLVAISHVSYQCHNITWNIISCQFQNFCEVLVVEARDLKPVHGIGTNPYVYGPRVGSSGRRTTCSGLSVCRGAGAWANMFGAVQPSGATLAATGKMHTMILTDRDCLILFERFW